MLVLIVVGVFLEESKPEDFFRQPKQERSRAFLRTILGEEAPKQEETL